MNHSKPRDGPLHPHFSRYYIDEVIGSKQYDKKLDVEAHFVKENNGCQQVRHNSLFVARTTYFNRIKDGAIPASVMDFDLDAQGQVTWNGGFLVSQTTGLIQISYL